MIVGTNLYGQIPANYLHVYILFRQALGKESFRWPRGAAEILFDEPNSTRCLTMEHRTCGNHPGILSSAQIYFETNTKDKNKNNLHVRIQFTWLTDPLWSTTCFVEHKQIIAHVEIQIRLEQLFKIRKVF